MWATKGLQVKTLNCLLELLSYCFFVLTAYTKTVLRSQLFNGRKACHNCREKSAKISNDRKTLRDGSVNLLSGEGITFPVLKL